MAWEWSDSLVFLAQSSGNYEKYFSSPDLKRHLYLILEYHLTKKKNWRRHTHNIHSQIVWDKKDIFVLFISSYCSWYITWIEFLSFFLDYSMIDHSPYQTMTNLLSPTSSSSSTISSSNHQDLLYPSSIYHQHSSEVIVSPHRSSLMIQPSNSTSKTRQQTHEQTDSDCDLDSSSSSSITNSSKLKKRRANLPKDSVRRTNSCSVIWNHFLCFSRCVF